MSGFIHDRATCGRCNARCHEFVRENRGEILISCAFCGQTMWVFGSAPKGVEVSNGTHTLKYGRFAGKTLEQISKEPRGVEYLELLANDNAKLRDTINTFLRSVVSAKRADLGQAASTAKP